MRDFQYQPSIPNTSRSRERRAGWAVTDWEVGSEAQGWAEVATAAIRAATVATVGSAAGSAAAAC